MPRETKETNHVGTMGRNHKRNPKPENNEPKTSADVQPISKNPNPTVNKQLAKQGNIKPNLERKTTYPKSLDNPPLAQRRTPFCLGRRGGKEPAGQSHRSIPYSSSVVEGPYRPGEGQAEIPSGRSVTEPALSKCVATERNNRMPTGTTASRSACPVRGRGGRSEIPTASPTHCAHGHSRKNQPIRREQGPRGGRGGAMPHKRALAVTDISKKIPCVRYVCVAP